MRFCQLVVLVLLTVALSFQRAAGSECRTPISKQTASKMSASLLASLPTSLAGWRVTARYSSVEDASGPDKPCRYAKASVHLERNNCTLFVNLLFNRQSKNKSIRFHNRNKNYRKKKIGVTLFYFLEENNEKSGEKVLGSITLILGRTLGFVLSADGDVGKCLGKTPVTQLFALGKLQQISR